MAVHYAPEGYRTVTPYLVVSGAAEAIEWYKKAFNAQDVVRMPMPDGRIMHAEIKIGDSFIMMSDEFPEMGGNKSPKNLGGTATGIHLYVPDCDAIFNQAVAAGATAKMPPMDMFWGDRFSKLTDPFGHDWSISTHKEDLSDTEMQRRSEEWTTKMASGAGQ
jgi:PhnB protein